MEADEQRRRVEAARAASLATIGPDGRPHLVPICFVLAGETVYTAVDAKPKRSRRLQRVENLRVRPDVTLLVDEWAEDWSQLWWVRLRGEARVLDPGAEQDRALGLLVDKYEQYREHPPAGPVVAIALTEWRAWAAKESSRPGSSPSS